MAEHVEVLISEQDVDARIQAIGEQIARGKIILAVAQILAKRQQTGKDGQLAPDQHVALHQWMTVGQSSHYHDLNKAGCTESPQPEWEIVQHRRGNSIRSSPVQPSYDH